MEWFEVERSSGQKVDVWKGGEGSVGVGSGSGGWRVRRVYQSEEARERKMEWSKVGQCEEGAEWRGLEKGYQSERGGGGWKGGKK